MVLQRGLPKGVIGNLAAGTGYTLSERASGFVLFVFRIAKSS
jgi:hypothetical protein